MNPAEKAQNRAESVIEKRLRKVYGNARDEMRKQLTAFEKRTKSLEADMVAKRDRGEITEDELKKWRQYRVFRGENWRSQIDAMTQTLEQSNRVALQIVNGKTSDVFAAGRNYKAYEIESDLGARIGTSFELYDEATVARLLRKQPELLPRRKKLNGQKDRAWNTKNVSDTVTSGILQGKSVQEVAEDLAKKLSSTNMVAMTRYARTAMTAAQNAGRIEAMHKAQEMGINVKKKWLATLDRHTRDSHQRMDGKIADVDEEFPNGLQYPGDPNGDPAEVYNCRCTLVSVYPEYPSANGKRRDGEGNVIGAMTYMAWEKAKKGVAPFEMPDSKEVKSKQPKLLSSGLLDKISSPEEFELINGSVVDTAIANKIKAVNYQRLKTELSEKQIISKISRNDKTLGSCTSQALAYIANKAGYDVTDFRGGKSTKLFTMRDCIESIGKLQGVKSKFITAYDDISSVNNLLEKLEIGKEYLLFAGQHSAIVKRNATGRYEFLDLQNKSRKGFTFLNDYVLLKRFKCKREYIKDGEKMMVTSGAIDIQSLFENDEFLKILKYVNSKGT